jgi:hypothetical protein
MWKYARPMGGVGSRDKRWKLATVLGAKVS